MNKFTLKFLKNNLGMNEDDARLVMEAQRKFPSIMVEDREGFCVNARMQWKELGQPHGEFNKWVDRKLITQNYKKNKDFSKVDRFVEVGNLKRPQVDYNLTLNCAKKIAMRENTVNGDLVCDYFIKLEKAIKDGIEWEKLRFPQKQGYKEMCKIIDTNYLENHLGIEKTPNHVYSNEANMINKALLGYSAKKLKAILEVEQKDITRDNLQLECNKALLELQILNGSLILNNINYTARKVMIENTCKSRFVDLKNRFNKTFAKDMQKKKL
jgi:phage anti-repressor protein